MMRSENSLEPFSVGMHLPAGLFTRLAEDFQAPDPVLVIFEDSSTPVPEIHHAGPVVVFAWSESSGAGICIYGDTTR